MVLARSGGAHQLVEAPHRRQVVRKSALPAIRLQQRAVPVVRVSLGRLPCDELEHDHPGTFARRRSGGLRGFRGRGSGAGGGAIHLQDLGGDRPVKAVKGLHMELQVGLVVGYTRRRLLSPLPERAAEAGLSPRGRSRGTQGSCGRAYSAAAAPRGSRAQAWAQASRAQASRRGSPLPPAARRQS